MTFSDWLSYSGNIYLQLVRLQTVSTPSSPALRVQLLTIRLLGVVSMRDSWRGRSPELSLISEISSSQSSHQCQVLVYQAGIFLNHTSLKKGYLFWNSMELVLGSWTVFQVRSAWLNELSHFILSYFSGCVKKESLKLKKTW